MQGPYAEMTPKYAVKYAGKKCAKYAEKIEKYAEIKCLFWIT